MHEVVNTTRRLPRVFELAPIPGVGVADRVRTGDVDPAGQLQRPSPECAEAAEAASPRPDAFRVAIHHPGRRVARQRQTEPSRDTSVEYSKLPDLLEHH